MFYSMGQFSFDWHSCFDIFDCFNGFVRYLYTKLRGTSEGQVHCTSNIIKILLYTIMTRLSLFYRVNYACVCKCVCVSACVCALRLYI